MFKPLLGNPLAKLSRLNDAVDWHVLGTNLKGKFKAGGISRADYDNNGFPAMTEYLASFARVSNGSWVVNGTTNKVLNLANYSVHYSVHGYARRQLFLTTLILKKHPRPKIPYYKMMINQIAEEEELQRLAGKCQVSQTRFPHRTPDFALRELAQARTYLLASKCATRPAASLPAGAFSNLVERFQTVAAF